MVKKEKVEEPQEEEQDLESFLVPEVVFGRQEMNGRAEEGMRMEPAVGIQQQQRRMEGDGQADEWGRQWWHCRFCDRKFAKKNSRTMHEIRAHLKRWSTSNKPKMRVGQVAPPPLVVVKQEPGLLMEGTSVIEENGGDMWHEGAEWQDEEIEGSIPVENLVRDSYWSGGNVQRWKTPEKQRSWTKDTYHLPRECRYCKRGFENGRAVRLHEIRAHEKTWSRSISKNKEMGYVGPYCRLNEYETEGQMRTRVTLEKGGVPRKPKKRVMWAETEVINEEEVEEEYGYEEVERRTWVNVNDEQGVKELLGGRDVSVTLFKIEIREIS